MDNCAGGGESGAVDSADVDEGDKLDVGVELFVFEVIIEVCTLFLLLSNWVFEL